MCTTDSVVGEDFKSGVEVVELRGHLVGSVGTRAMFAPLVHPERVHGRVHVQVGPVFRQVALHKYHWWIQPRVTN